MRYYLAGPMSGIPQFNFPLFASATEDLRKRGLDIVSPAELDAEFGVDKEALASTDGDAAKLSQTWGDLLARDVKLIADGLNAVIFLPNWQTSKGAKLEAFVGLLAKYPFFLYHGPNAEIEPISSGYVLDQIYKQMIR